MTVATFLKKLSEFNFSEFATGVLRTLVGGLLLAWVFFLLENHFFSSPVQGFWYCQEHINESNVTERETDGLVVGYWVMLTRIGDRIDGHTEKLYDYFEHVNGIEGAEGGATHYPRGTGVKGTLNGSITDSIFSNYDTVFLHKAENERDFIYELAVESSDRRMSGIFESTIADENGTLVCDREPFDPPQ